MEDDPVIRQHLARIFEGAADLILTGEARSVAEGRELIKQPLDLLVLDLGLEDGSGLTLIAEALKTATPPRILVLTVFGDETSVMSALAAGADGYVLKDSPDDDLLDNVRQTLNGGSPISASVAAYLLRHLRTAPPPTPEPSDETHLTTRELELLKLLAKGLSNKEVALALEISHYTVGDHIKAIYRKLAVRSRGEAVFEAFHRGLIRQ
ncbi:bacterial regulatory protein, luxR family protein [Asticcacaulis biprosthecium C19]|uniref:Bacterial regulatory protein, luxR family protein n=1 Tax=Asticcacaulis biprosthecium C19 TaxID=715226 RepID=F4QH97_9CAUL|nr:bacterial regulatory protein, luxR family protein [Asticcacaulis biprosthecium C19]